MRRCSQCSSTVERSFRYCPWCAAPQRLKLVEFFRPHPQIQGDRGKALRVSRYMGEAEDERHIRFSVWDESGELVRAEAAVSLEESEAARLADFLAETAPTMEVRGSSTSR